MPAIAYDPAAERYRLLRGADRRKDQSYVLYQLTQYQLSHLLLPVGDFDKPTIRDNAREAGLLNADKSDSQDICFVPDGDYVSFLRGQGVTLEPGDFVDEEGNVLGRHRGLPCYTIGQGKGLGISVGKHVYVLAKHEADNTVVLGDNDRLFRRELTACRVNWIAGEAPAAAFRCTAKTRYSQVEAAGPGGAVAGGTGAADLRRAPAGHHRRTGGGAVRWRRGAGRRHHRMTRRFDRWPQTVHGAYRYRYAPLS